MNDKSTEELLEMFNRGECRDQVFSELSQRGVELDLGSNHGKGGGSRLRLKRSVVAKGDPVGVLWTRRILGVVAGVAVIGVIGHLRERAELEDWANKLNKRQHTLENLRKELAGVRQQAQDTEQELEQVRSRQTTVQEGREARNQASARFLELGKQLNETTAALYELNKQRMNLVKQVRQAAVGEAIPKLTLRDGKRLESLEIRRVTDDAVAFKQPTGVTEVDWRNLPQPLVARFQLGDAYRLPSPDDTKESSPKETITAAIGSPERLSALGVTQSAAHQLNSALNTRREEAVRLKAQLMELREKAEEERALQRKARRARQASIHDTLAEEAEAKAKQVEYKLRPLEQRIRELEKIFKQ